MHLNNAYKIIVSPHPRAHHSFPSMDPASVLQMSCICLSGWLWLLEYCNSCHELSEIKNEKSYSLWLPTYLDGMFGVTKGGDNFGQISIN